MGAVMRTPEWDYKEVNEISRRIYLEGHLEDIPKLYIFIPSIVTTCYYKSIKQLDDNCIYMEDLISTCLEEMWLLLRRRWDLLLKCNPNQFHSYYMRLCTLNMKGNLAILNNSYSDNKVVSLTDIDVAVKPLREVSQKTKFYRDVNNFIQKWKDYWNKIFNRPPTVVELRNVIYKSVKETYGEAYAKL